LALLSGCKVGPSVGIRGRQPSSFCLGFREDVSIRITPDGEESRVDIRSSSRYFESDLGSNAARVTKLIEDINSAVDNAKPAQKKPQTPAKAPAKTVKK